jgi:DNA invertase Pin-like site-specific DNA recombinase
MMTAASPAPPWIGPLCSSSSPSRRADIVVVDKINRLTRSLADFA